MSDVLFDSWETLPLFLWLPNLLMLTIPVAGVGIVSALAQQHAARPVHACERCGYDLQATPFRCPECGLPAPEAKPCVVREPL